jgi:Ca2+-transporting ATPase
MTCLQGAVENILDRSSFLQLSNGEVVALTDAAKAALLKKLNALSSKALRCLGFAYKDDLHEFATYDGESHPAHKLLLDPANYSNIESNLVFVGMSGLRVRDLSYFILLICCTLIFQMQPLSRFNIISDYCSHAYFS